MHQRYLVSKFAHQFIGILGSEGVIDPEGLVGDGDPGSREIFVMTEHLTSSEADAVVKAMEATLIAPIKIRGEVIYEDGSVFQVNASFTSARGGRRVVLQRWDSYIDEALGRYPRNSHFVAANLGKDAREGEEDFRQVFIARYITSGRG